MKDAQSASDTGKAREKKSSSSSTASGFILGKPQPSLGCIPEADVPSSLGQHPESGMHLLWETICIHFSICINRVNLISKQIGGTQVL